MPMASALVRLTLISGLPKSSSSSLTTCFSPPHRPRTQRPPGDHRGPPRSGFHRHHQPVSNQRLASHHREPTIADAICDRLLNHCYKIELKGESIRKSKK